MCVRERERESSYSCRVGRVEIIEEALVCTKSAL